MGLGLGHPLAQTRAPARGRHQKKASAGAGDDEKKYGGTTYVVPSPDILTWSSFKPLGDKVGPGLFKTPVVLAPFATFAWNMRYWLHRLVDHSPKEDSEYFKFIPRPQ